MRENPKGVRFADARKVATHFFGEPRASGSSHFVWKMPWPGDPRVNLQNAGGKAKPYQVRQLLAAISNGHLPLVRATHNGRHGHPVVFARRVFDELRHADPSVGARAIVPRHVLEGIDLEVDDAGVLLDIDEPADYERAMRRLSGDD